MFKSIKSFVQNKFVNRIGIFALICGLVFTVWAIIPIGPVQSDLDEVIKDEQLEIIDKPNYVVLRAKDSVATTGLIFYPGAKVDSKAYLYKLAPLARQESAVVFVTKPFLKYAFTDVNGADKVREENKNIKTWILGGHSLGGSMACKYTKDHSEIKYLILIGSYCVDDLSKSSVRALSILGSEDGLISKDKIDKYKSNLPANTRYETIQGMNHAQAGNYGSQLGDKPSKSPDSFVKLQISVVLNSYFRG